MNTDTNPCWYIISRNEEYCASACRMLKEAYAHSGVIEELIYRLYWSEVNSDTSLKERDILRDTTVTAILKLYQQGYLGGENRLLVTFALDIFRYRRLDWVDSYLIARYILLRESFGTFDGKMTKAASMIKEAHGKIPVISGYTLSVDSLPSHVFVKPEDSKEFMRAGLLHLDLK